MDGQAKRLVLDYHPGQQRVRDNKARFRVVVAGRRFGKSWLAINEAICAALDEANVQQHPVFLIAPTFDQARRVYWQRLLKIAGPIIESHNYNNGEIRLVNGVTIHIKGSDRPDTLRGVGMFFAVLDEYADMKSEVWELIVRPALSDAQGRAIFIGTPKGRDGFYTLCEQAKVDDSGEWSVFEFTTSENPYIPKVEIESARRTLSSSAFRQEFEASFESGGAGIFRREWVREAPEPKDGQRYIAVDLAGFEDVIKTGMLKTTRLDQTAIVVVKAHQDKWWIADIIFGRWDVKKTAEQIVLTAKKYEPIAVGIERGSLKNAVEPYLREQMAAHKSYFAITTLTHGNKSKDNRIIWALQGRLEHGNITFKEGATWLKEIEDQLVHYPSRTVHDDLVDALAYIVDLANAVMFDASDFTSDEEGWIPMDAEVGY